MWPRLFGWILFLCVFSLPGFAQRTTPPPSSRDIAAPSPEEDEVRARLSNEMAKKATKERVAALKNSIKDGSYRIDRSSTFTFHIEGGLVRTLIGKDLKRAYEISGNRLTVKSTDPHEHWKVVWERY